LFLERNSYSNERTKAMNWTSRFTPGSQRDRLIRLMADGKKRTLEEIHEVLGGSMTSLSADLRNLRKPRYGAWPIKSTPNKMVRPFYYWLEVGRA
jgi:hypothetical protein